MARKVVKAMTRICTAPMRSSRGTLCRYSAFTFTELIAVVIIMAFVLMLAMTNPFALLGRQRFKARLGDFVSTMQMAATAAAESNRRFEVIIDFTEQSYMRREITSPDLSEVLEEEIIADSDFSERCYAAYVLFDDDDYTNEGVAKFRAGHAGWQYGGKIVFLDEDDQAYSVVVNRLSRAVSLEAGDVEIQVPKRADEVPF